MIRHGNITVREVILHTAATPGDWWKGKTVAQMRDAIDGWHKKRGWKGIGYHRVVAPDGTMANGRSIYKQGAHVSGHNKGTIGICMIPVKTHAGITRFEDYFTEAQRRSVKSYIAELADLTPIQRVSGHNDYTNAKECPGFKVDQRDWLPTKAFVPRDSARQPDAPPILAPQKPDRRPDAVVGGGAVVTGIGGLVALSEGVPWEYVVGIGAVAVIVGLIVWKRMRK